MACSAARNAARSPASNGTASITAQVSACSLKSSKTPSLATLASQTCPVCFHACPQLTATQTNLLSQQQCPYDLPCAPAGSASSSAKLKKGAVRRSSSAWSFGKPSPRVGGNPADPGFAPTPASSRASASSSGAAAPGCASCTLLSGCACQGGGPRAPGAPAAAW